MTKRSKLRLILLDKLIVKANKYNESIERIFYIDKVINQITFTDIKKLAKKYFDDTYFETLQLLEE